MRKEYHRLGMAVLRQACRDLIRFSGARNRKEYRSARRFLDSDLFGLICRAGGADPDRTRQLILRYTESAHTLHTRKEQTRIAEERPAYRAR